VPARQKRVQNLIRDLPGFVVLLLRGVVLLEGGEIRGLEPRQWLRVICSDGCRGGRSGEVGRSRRRSEDEAGAREQCRERLSLPQIQR